MELWDLPSEWEWRQVQEVAEDTERRNPRLDPETTFRYVDISSVDNEKGAIKTDEARTIVGREAPSRARKVIKVNDVIFATTRPYLKNIALIPADLDDQVCSTGFCVLRARQGAAEPKYIYYACRSDFFINQLLPKQRGANYPAVTDGDVFDTRLPIPYPENPARSLAEQRRIVARIETLFEELREMQRLNNAIKEDTGRLMGAVLGEVFSDLVAKYECVTIKRLKQQEALSITGGGTPSTEKTEYWTGSIPWASPKDMKTWLIGDTQKHITQEAIEESSAKRVKAGSILVVVRGMILARTWPVAIARVELAINQDMKALTPCGELDERFLGYMLRALTPEVLGRVETAAHGTKRLPSDVLEALEIPLPERTVQKRIAVYLENVESEIRAMQDIQADDEQALQHVEQAILMKAFRGEL